MVIGVAHSGIVMICVEIEFQAPRAIDAMVPITLLDFHTATHSCRALISGNSTGLRGNQTVS